MGVTRLESKPINYEPAGGGVVLERGLKQRDEHIAHHNFVFACDYEEECVAICNRGEPTPDGTAYLCAPLRPRAANNYSYPGLAFASRLDKIPPTYRGTIIEKRKRTAGRHGEPD